jgi:hypothetical protein
MQVVINTQKAVYAALNAELSVDIYDFVPDDAVLPYVTIGNSLLTQIPSLNGSVYEITLSVNGYSAGNGRKELLAIAEEIYQLLNNQPVTIEDHTHHETRLLSQSVSMAEGNEKYALSANYRILVN